MRLHAIRRSTLIFEPTVDEVREAEARARERIAIGSEVMLPVLAHGPTVAHALNVLAR